MRILSNLKRFEHFRANDIGCLGSYFGVIFAFLIFIEMARPEGFEPPTPWFVAFCLVIKIFNKQGESNSNLISFSKKVNV